MKEMVVRLIELETDKVILEYDVSQEILDKFSETQEEEDNLDKPYMALVDAEYMALLSLKPTSQFTINKKRYVVLDVPNIDADEGTLDLFVEEYVSTTVSSSSGFGKKKKKRR